MEIDKIESAKQIAEDFIKSREEAKAKAAEANLTDEQKAASAKADAEAKLKAEEEAKAIADKEAKADELVDKPEDQLNDEEKKLLAEIESKELELDEKTRMERGLKKSRKRIDKLTAKLRQEEDEKAVLAEEIKRLRQEFEGIKKDIVAPVEKKQAVSKLAEIEKQAIAQAVVEDSELPKEQRREMSNEDLQEFFVEDPVAAQEWIAQREQRRAEFRQQLKAQETNASQANQLIEKQKESINRFVKKFPNAKPDGEMALLLKSGVTQDEMVEILSKKYPEYRLANEIVTKAIEDQKSGKDSIINKENFGELLQAELEARLEKERGTSGAKTTKKVYTEEEVAQRIKEAQEMERQRLARVDTGSSSSRTVVPQTTQKRTSDEEFFYRHGQKAGLSQDRIERIIKAHNEKMRRGFSVAPQGKDDDE